MSGAGRLNIAYVCADPGVPVFGSKGCSIHVQEVIRAMCGLGHRVTLFATRFDGDPPGDLRDSITVYALPAAPKGDLAAREQLCIRNNAALAGALDAHGQFDLMYGRYSLWSSAAMRWAACNNVASILEVNAPLITETAEQRGLLDRASAEAIAHELFRSATAITTVSQPLVDYVERFEPSALGRVYANPNGINSDLFNSVRPPAQSEPFTVGFVGSFKPWHGIDVLLDAFGLLQDARLLIVGDGPERPRIQETITARGFGDRVMLTGAVPHQQIPAMLGQMHVAVAPYLPCPDFYFSPMKVYEYMAAGVPVIASRAGQMIQAIRDQQTGLLVTPGDAQDLAGAIRQLQSDPRKRDAMAQRARQEVPATRSWKGVVQRILSLPQLALSVAGAAS